ncbi:MAG: MarR family winged helix-turn-helix transcriptional regulator [Bacilli bacterium]
MNKQDLIGYEIKTLDNMIERSIISQSKNYNHQLLTPIQAKIIHFLVKNQDNIIYQNDIEREFKFRRSTATGIFQTMEKNGLIARINSKEDARKKQVILTKSTLDKTKDIKKKLSEYEQKLKKDINEEDLKIFFKVIKKIKDNISK